MARNPYFKNSGSGVPEQRLIDQLGEEIIQTMGENVLYLPYERDESDDDDIFGEDAQFRYERPYHIEMYLESVDGFEGEGDLFAKFGVQLRDSATLVVNKRRFFEETGTKRPLENDLIYVPVTDSLFKITYVNDQEPFFQMGKNYIYKITVEQFIHSNETFNTGNPRLDSITKQVGFVGDFDLNSGGTGAFSSDEYIYQLGATGATLASGKVKSFDADGLELKVYEVIGDFTASRPVYGLVSGAEWVLAGDGDLVTDDNSADNDPIEDYADGILDWSDKNPFGEL